MGADSLIKKQNTCKIARITSILQYLSIDRCVITKAVVNNSFLDINTQTILHSASLINRRNIQLAGNKDVAVFIQRIRFIISLILINNNNNEFSIVPRLNPSNILYRSNSNRNSLSLSLC